MQLDALCKVLVCSTYHININQIKIDVYGFNKVFPTVGNPKTHQDVDTLLKINAECIQDLKKTIDKLKEINEGLINAKNEEN